MTAPLHIVGRFDDPHAGAERSLPGLADALRGRRPVSVWSDVPPHPYFVQRGVRAMLPGQGDGPAGGHLLVAGVHVRLGSWLERCGASRITLHYNLPSHQRLFDAISRIRAATGIDPELVFVSGVIRASVGLPGRIEPCLIRLDDFVRIPLPRMDKGQLTVGRVSRDVLEKHDPQDVTLYRMLAARGVRVRILGGRCLGPWLGAEAGIELLPAGAEPVEEFLAGLDIFFYRTGTFSEPYGRVVLEAMAAGLPVVVAANGGYAEQIRQGQDGLLVSDQNEAIVALQKLVMSAETRHRIGAAARERALQLHGPQASARIAENYLQ